jgi:hypothetical protein
MWLESAYVKPSVDPLDDNLILPSFCSGYTFSNPLYLLYTNVIHNHFTQFCNRQIRHPLELAPQNIQFESKLHSINNVLRNLFLIRRKTPQSIITVYDLKIWERTPSRARSNNGAHLPFSNSTPPNNPVLFSGKKNAILGYFSVLRVHGKGGRTTTRFFQVLLF